jgi:hypothetical protein
METTVDPAIQQAFLANMALGMSVGITLFFIVAVFLWAIAYVTRWMSVEW